MPYSGVCQTRGAWAVEVGLRAVSPDRLQMKRAASMVDLVVVVEIDRQWKDGHPPTWAN